MTLGQQHRLLRAQHGQTYQRCCADMNESVYCNICTTNFQSFEEEVYYPLVKHPLHVIVILTLAYGLAFLFAVVGNCFVIAVVLKYPWMRTVTNYFVVNLAVADLLIAIFNVPFTLVDNIYSGKLWTVIRFYGHFIFLQLWFGISVLPLS